MKIYYKKIMYSILGASCIGGLLFSQDQIFAKFISNSNIRLGIYNSYSGSIGFQAGQNIINFGGNIRTDNTTLGIVISATTGSSYSISGGTNIITGYGSGNYFKNYTINLSNGEGVKTIYGSFLRNTEPYNTNLNIIVDQTAPSQAQIIYPNNNSIISGTTLLSRTPSNDIGIGLAYYKVHLSSNAGFLGKTIVVSTGNTVELGENDLPIGIIFRYIEAIDHLGYSSNSAPGSFQYKEYNITGQNQNPGNSGIGNYTPPIQNHLTNIITGTATNIIANTTGNILGRSGSNTVLPLPQKEIEQDIPIQYIENTTPIIINPALDKNNNNITRKNNNNSNITRKNNNNSNITRKRNNNNNNNITRKNNITISNNIDNFPTCVKEYSFVNYDILSDTDQGDPSIVKGYREKILSILYKIINYVSR